MLGYVILPNGEVVESRGYGSKGMITGLITPVISSYNTVKILTLPALSERITLFFSPSIGSVGYTPLVESSLGITSNAIIARDIVDYPSYIHFFKPLFYLIKHEGKKAVTSIEVEKIGKMVGKKAAVVVGVDLTEIEGGVQRALSLIKKNKKPSWKKSYCVIKKLIRGGKDEMRISILDLGRTLQLERSLSRMGTLMIHPPGSSVKDIKSFKPHLLVITSGPGEPVDSLLKDAVREIIPLVGVVPILSLGHGTLALLDLLNEKLREHPQKGVVETASLKGLHSISDGILFHTIQPALGGEWQEVIWADTVFGEEAVGWINAERRIAAVLLEDGEMVLSYVFKLLGVGV